MPAASRNTGSTEQTGSSRGRFTVALPDEVGHQLDEIGKRLSQSLFESAGVEITLSRPDIIKAVVQTAVKVQAEQTTED